MQVSKFSVFTGTCGCRLGYPVHDAVSGLPGGGMMAEITHDITETQVCGSGDHIEGSRLWGVLSLFPFNHRRIRPVGRYHAG